MLYNAVVSVDSKILLLENFIASIGNRSYSIIHSLPDEPTKLIKSIGGHRSKILPLTHFQDTFGKPLLAEDTVSQGEDSQQIKASGFRQFEINGEHLTHGKAKEFVREINFFLSGNLDATLSMLPHLETNIQADGGSSVFPKLLWNKFEQTLFPVEGIGQLNGQLYVFTNDSFKNDFKKKNLSELLQDTVLYDGALMTLIAETPFKDALGCAVLQGDVLAVTKDNETTISPVFTNAQGRYMYSSTELKDLFNDSTNQIIRVGSVYSTIDYKLTSIDI